MTASSETPQTEGEGPDGSDKPPHADIRHPHPSNTSQLLSQETIRANGTKHRQTPSHSKPQNHASASPHKNGTFSANNGHIPLPPPDFNAYQKFPERTRADLEQYRISHQDHVKNPSSSTADSMVRSTSGSISPTESEISSAPSTRPPSRPPSLPPSRPPSRPSSFSAGKSGGKVAPLTAVNVKAANKKQKESKKGSKGSPTQSQGDASNRAPSVHSDGGGQKFTLKDLLGSAPKLGRRSSARSASSKKSDSERGGKSGGGETTASLLKKYGVCEKVAIGKGATSVVRLAHKWDRTEEKLYAVKEFRKRRKNETEKEYVKKLTAEFCISSTLHHPNIVETVDLVQDENLHWCEVMEFCPGGDLYAAIKRGGMAPAEVECCFKQILTGLNYLHNQGVAHRDIKPENLFFDMFGHLKIGDYGASTVYRLPWETTIHMSTGLCGSEPYIAPEQFFGKPYDARLVDIWACGIVYYCLHFQELPWTVAQPSDNLFGAYVAACSSSSAATSSCPPTINNLSPRACRPVIRKMLEPNPKLRATIEDIMAEPWIQSIEVCTEVKKPSHVHVYVQAIAVSQSKGTS